MSTVDPLQCFIGIPTSQITSNHDESDKRISKIGGQPVWWDNLSAPSSVNEIWCRSCNSNVSTIFVAQMYAPIDFDRSLYIFCCNKRTCSLTSDGWTIIRNQQLPTAVTSKSEITAGFSSTSSPCRDATDWGAVAVSAATSSTSAWSNFLGVEEEIDMLSLLEARDTALVSRKLQGMSACSGGTAASVVRDYRAGKGKGQGEITEEGAKPQRVQQALVCWKVEAIVDPCPYGSDTLIRAPLDGNNHDDEDEDEGIYAASSSSEVCDHVQHMLAGYIAAAEAEGGDDLGKDDPFLLELLKKEICASNGKGRVKSKEPKCKEEIKLPSAVNLSDPKLQKNDKRRGIVVPSGDGDGDTSMFKKSDCCSRVETAFVAAISHAPSQVVRFAYGGDPLWCTYPPPDMSVPRCICGSERVFEMQLMPGLLALHPLFTEDSIRDTAEKNVRDSRADSLVSSATANMTTAQSILQTLSGDSFEFGVLAVFSCPDSCPSSSFSFDRQSPSSSSSSNDENNGRDHSKSDQNLSGQTKLKNQWTSSHISYEYAVVQPPADF